MIYLASPYTDADPRVQDQRYSKVARTAGRLLLEGRPAFSPIAYTVSLVRAADGQLDNLPLSFWLPFDMWFLERCKEVVVLGLDGFNTSPGVRAEVTRAIALGKRITLLGWDNPLVGQASPP